MNAFNARLSAKSNLLLLLWNAFNALTATLIREICDKEVSTKSPKSRPPSVALAQYALIAWLSKGRDAMKLPDYIVIGVLILVLVWAVADQFPRGKL